MEKDINREMSLEKHQTSWIMEKYKKAGTLITNTVNIYSRFNLKISKYFKPI